jgi:sec-independent protein translocase protein TatA
MDIGIPELLIVLVVVLLLFGPGRIAKTAGELGKGIRAFRDGVTGKDDTRVDETSADPAPEGLSQDKHA